MKYLPFLCTCLLLAGCTDRLSDDSDLHNQLIRDGVAIRVSEFRKKEWSSCIVRAESMAIQRADSLIRARAGLEPIEPIFKPPKPERPEKPPLKILPDTLRPDSLIRDEIQF